MKKFTVLIGNYGSGKTEIAVNLAVNAAKEGKRTLVVDLDKVNDYFRMSDRVTLLKDRHVNLVSPTLAGRGVTPVNMSAAVQSAFADDWDRVIFDVGGDSAGAMSLGRYHSDFAALPPETLQVLDIVNVFRPTSETPEKILKLKQEMESFARLSVTGFVNNSNLLNFASADDIRHGYDVLRETSELSGIPVVFTTGRPECIEGFLADGRDAKYIGTPIALQTYMHRSWEAFTNEGF